MKPHDDHIHLKGIIAQSQVQVPSPDFNSIVLAAYEAECGKVRLKPAISYTLLMVLDVMVLLVAGLGLYLHFAHETITTSLPGITIGPRQLSIAVTAMIVFTLFLVLADIFEDRGLLPSI